MKQRPLNDSDIDMLKYFWEEKGSIERYADFEEIKRALKKERPDILKAWEEYKTAIDIMNAVLSH